MQEILKQLATVPGVVGSMVYGARGEIVASEFPPLFEASALQRAARLLADDQVFLGSVRGVGASLDLRYAAGRALVQAAGAGTLFVLCTPAANAQLVRLSVSQASRRLETLGSPAPRAAAPPRRSAQSPELADARERLQRALVRQIGPIGEFVMEQAWADWTASAPPSFQTMAKLLSALGREVEDADARAKFLEEAREILSG